MLLAGATRAELVLPAVVLVRTPIHAFLPAQPRGAILQVGAQFGALLLLGAQLRLGCGLGYTVTVLATARVKAQRRGPNLLLVVGAAGRAGNHNRQIVLLGARRFAQHLFGAPLHAPRVPRRETHLAQHTLAISTARLARTLLARGELALELLIQAPRYAGRAAASRLALLRAVARGLALFLTRIRQARPGRGRLRLGGLFLHALRKVRATAHRLTIVANLQLLVGVARGLRAVPQCDQITRLAPAAGALQVPSAGADVFGPRRAHPRLTTGAAQVVPTGVQCRAHLARLPLFACPLGCLATLNAGPACTRLALVLFLTRVGTALFGRFALLRHARLVQYALRERHTAALVATLHDGSKLFRVVFALANARAKLLQPPLLARRPTGQLVLAGPQASRDSRFVHAELVEHAGVVVLTRLRVAAVSRLEFLAVQAPVRQTALAAVVAAAVGRALIGLLAQLRAARHFRILFGLGFYIGLGHFAQLELHAGLKGRRTARRLAGFDGLQLLGRLFAVLCTRRDLKYVGAPAGLGA